MPSSGAIRSATEAEPCRQDGRVGVADLCDTVPARPHQDLEGQVERRQRRRIHDASPDRGVPEDDQRRLPQVEADRSRLGALVDHDEDLLSLRREQVEQPGDGVTHRARARLRHRSRRPPARRHPVPASRPQAPTTHRGPDPTRPQPARAGRRDCPGAARPSPGPAAASRSRSAAPRSGSLRHWAHSTTHVRSGRLGNAWMVVLHLRLLHSPLGMAPPYRGGDRRDNAKSDGDRPNDRWSSSPAA